MKRSLWLLLGPLVWPKELVILNWTLDSKSNLLIISTERRSKRCFSQALPGIQLVAVLLVLIAIFRSTCQLTERLEEAINQPTWKRDLCAAEMPSKEVKSFKQGSGQTHHNTSFLEDEREGPTGVYWPKIVTFWTEYNGVHTKTTEGQYSPVLLEQAKCRLVSHHHHVLFPLKEIGP